VLDAPVRQYRDEPAARLLHVERSEGDEVEVARAPVQGAEPQPHQHPAAQDEAVGVWQAGEAQQQPLEQAVTEVTAPRRALLAGVQAGSVAAERTLSQVSR